MTEHLKPPPVPADCDLRNFPFMPIDIARLLGSEFSARAKDTEWRAGVTLWLKAYHEIPAGMIPDDDVVLAHLAQFGRDVKSWKKVRAMALHGWIKHSDRRLYHPVVVEKVIEAWQRKEAFRSRTEKARLTRLAQRNASESSHKSSVTDPVTEIVTDYKNDVDTTTVTKCSTTKNKSVTESATNSVTEPVTESVTEPIKDSVTELVTKSVTASTGTRTVDRDSRQGQEKIKTFGAPQRFDGAEPVPRGTLLPDDWTLPEEWRSWAQARKSAWSGDKITQTAERFRNYWVAKI